MRVELKGVGEFGLEVRRLGRDARDDIREFASGVEAALQDEGQVPEALQRFRRQALEMLHAATGLEIEWGPDDVERPETGAALLAALERLDPERWPRWLVQVWRICWQEQFLPPFAEIRSASSPGSAPGSAGSRPAGRRGAKRKTATRAGPRGSAGSGAAATTTTDR